jgi:hypothetical protein
LTGSLDQTASTASSSQSWGKRSAPNRLLRRRRTRDLLMSGCAVRPLPSSSLFPRGIAGFSRNEIKPPGSPLPASILPAGCVRRPAVVPIRNTPGHSATPAFVRSHRSGKAAVWVRCEGEGHETNFHRAAVALRRRSCCRHRACTGRAELAEPSRGNTGRSKTGAAAERPLRRRHLSTRREIHRQDNRIHPAWGRRHRGVGRFLASDRRRSKSFLRVRDFTHHARV